MFGLYRTMLALMVVALHIGGIPWLGGYAVFGFYMLSGYLMTMIMQKTYGYTAQGRAKYLLNRFLRIYPLYWLSALATLGLIYLMGEAYTSDYDRAMFYPVSVTDIIKNIFLIFPSLDTARLTPTAWALTVELFFYLWIALGISKYAKYTLWWLALSVVYHVLAWCMDWDRYLSVFAASLPFALGACLYFYRHQWLQTMFGKKEMFPAYIPLVLLTLMLINWCVGFVLGQLTGIFFYINIVICAGLLLMLSTYKRLPMLSKKADQYWGDFSYPIYLLHYQVALVVMFVLQRQGFTISRPDSMLMWVTIPFLFLVAWLLMIWVERPIERLRISIKAKVEK